MLTARQAQSLWTGFRRRNHGARRHAGEIVLGIRRALGDAKITLDDIVPPFEEPDMTDEQKRELATARLMIIVRRREKAGAEALQRSLDKKLCESVSQNQT